MNYKTGKNKTNGTTGTLFILFVVLAAAVVLTSRMAVRVPASDYDTKLAAYDRMRACMEAVKRYREEAGLALSPEDRFETGMIGLEWSGISTTLGDVSAKRTSAGPDMAALLVQMLAEAGAKTGDSVAIGASGSFPALAVATVCACNETGVRAVIIPSVGSSAFGANEPELPFPVMLERLRKDGLLSCEVPFVTWGGDFDTGAEMDGTEKARAGKTLSVYGLVPYEEPDFGKNLAARQQAYGDAVCFIGVGGNLTTLGKTEETLPAGVIAKTKPLRPVNENSGLLARYHAGGIPVINLLNIKQIAADYDLAFDPQALPARGDSAVFFETRFPKAPALAALAFAAVVLWKKRRRYRDETGSAPGDSCVTLDGTTFFETDSQQIGR